MNEFLKGYNGNHNLKRIGEEIEFSPDYVTELIKCSQDPVYFITNYCYIVSLDHGTILFKLFDYQIRFINEIHKNNRVISMQPRQSGKSQVVAAYILWYTLFNEAKTSAILANKASAAQEVMDRFQFMYEGLPLWMQSGIKVWNKRSIELENKSKVFIAATTASGLRGRSINLLYCDEVSIIPNTIADSFFTSVMPTISSGTTTKVILTSTPLGYNHWWKLWTDAENGLNGYVTVLVKYQEHPERNEEWAKNQLQILGALKFAQECQCAFNGSSASLLDSTTLSNLTSAPYIHSKDNLDVLIRPLINHVYVMIVDTSKGVRGDYSAFVVIDITENHHTVVAKYRNNNISPLLYPSVIVKIAKEYNDSFVLMEINSSEQVSYIVKQEYEYENVLSVTMGKNGQQIGGGFRGGSRFGVNTDKKVKRIGCLNLKDMIENHKLIVQDHDIIKEFSTFVENGRGSYAADDGYHDDLVMCLVLFGWLVNDNYFKDLTDTNLRKMLYDQEVKYIEDNLVPFGFLDNFSEMGDKENPFLTF